MPIKNDRNVWLVRLVAQHVAIMDIVSLAARIGPRIKKANALSPEVRIAMNVSIQVEIKQKN